ncbi:MAG: hypothetical protein ACOX5J_06340 [Candidatus Hydrogenedentales bacterium]|jgi:hypothetical protein
MKKRHFFLIIALGSLLAAPAIAESLDQEFERLYQEWRESPKQYENPFSSIMTQKDFDAIYTNNPAWRKMLDLGVEAVPLLIKKMETHPRAVTLVKDITKWRYHINRTGTPGSFVWTVEEFPDERKTSGGPRLDYTRLFERWWVEFRPQVPQRFAALYKEYNSLKDQGKKEEAEQKFQRIKDLGIDVLPLLIDKIQQGDTSLIPALAYLTDKKVPESASPSECVSWWAANKAKFTLPPATK